MMKTVKQLTTLSREKQPVRNDKHFESLYLSNKSRKEFGGRIGEIQEGYWLRDQTRAIKDGQTEGPKIKC